MDLKVIFLGEGFSQDLFEGVKKAILRLGFQHLQELKLPLYESEFNIQRGQYDAEKILSRFQAEGPQEKVLCITVQDIFVHGLNYVFGLASPARGAAIVSLHRLFSHEDRIFRERILKEASHELGHLFLLGHCRERLCVMSFSNSLLEVDLKSAEFCHSCNMQIRGQLFNDRE